MNNKQNHTLAGTTSLILGLLGIINVFIFGFIVCLPLGILAVILGHKAKKQGDKYGNYGRIIGGLLLILIITWTILASSVIMFTN